MPLDLREPWSVVNHFHDEIRRLAQNRRQPDAAGGLEPGTYDWLSAVDVIENSERFVLVADVPGVTLEGIEITTDNGVLTLKGERKDRSVKDSDHIKHFERVAGRFIRRFALPDGIDADRIEARGENGVLEISIPKVEKNKPRRIEVRH